MSPPRGGGPRRPWTLALVLLATASRCAHAPPPQAPTSAAPAAQMAADAERARAEAAYTRGQLQLRRGTYEEAIKTFDEVKTRYPYSPYATLSELAQADTYFREARYLEATDAYRSFLRFHPSHPEARYATGQVTESLYAQLPTAWWFMPPVAEKDPALLHQVLEACKDYLHRYPQGRGAERARTVEAGCRQKLADHELYVARFYHRRRHWAGARARALSLLATYPKLVSEPETLWLAGDASHRMGDAQAARALLDRLVTDYPQAAQAKCARALRHKLGDAAEESS